ncbi:MAG TPA: energy transducer TonB [Flavobacterium sp.]|uniref:energy transducer TonB n=1 Tax=Flavobacterium sp. TaxID=239 RepID=UPI002C617FBE|nr:energy transducer TonB [Flavobacterium sp.]HNP33289.1 energy transducer TonB [Flavobacterium sp.]
MKLIKILLFALLPIFGFSQIQGEDEVYLNGDRIEAKFGGGGIDNFTAFINRNFDYSKVTKPGKLEAAFTIDEQGNLTKIRITQILDIESATELIRVLKMSPKWEPAKRGGKPISIEIKYPMVFSAKPKPSTDVSETKGTQKNSDDNAIYNTASIESKPEFKGGLSQFYKFIGKNYQQPTDKNFKGGKVVVSFVIEKDGSITDIKVIKDCGFGTGEEAQRVLSKCPNWIPGEQDGKKVRVAYTLPITLQPSQ